jgi:hypothetical protein
MWRFRTVISMRLWWTGNAIRKGNKECIRNFGGETPWKASTWKIEKKIAE